MQPNEIARLVVDDRERGVFRVQRHAFLDRDILERERRDVFDRCWLYACHVSEVAKPGAYVARNVGGRPLLIARGADDRVRAFFNACTHRGNAIVRERSGSARAFTCFYHAWAFNLNGELISLPDEAGYTSAFDRKELALPQVPRFENYRGMLFVCYDPAVVSLESYLAGAREHLDAMIDFAGGDVEIIQGAQNYSMKANWKLLVENSMDGYHAMSTHHRYFRQYMPDLGFDTRQWGDLSDGPNEGGRALGNGHAVIKSRARPTPLSEVAAKEMAEIRARLDVQFGKERAHEIADYHRNLFIFPNLILISLWRTVRTFYPVSPDYMEIDAYGLFPRSESKALREKRIANFLSFLGPGGFATPDDVSGLEGCQRGFAANPAAWSDISRGMGRHPQSIDELQMRAFWRQWRAMMAGERGPVDGSDARVAPLVTAK